MCNVMPPGEPGEIDPQILASYQLGSEVGEQKVLRTFHAWQLSRDVQGERFVWTCSCGHTVFQRFDTPVPDELISHPQRHGQLRGE